jgi:hypothetical protein
MMVIYRHFSPGAVVRDRYQEGVDYLDHEFDLGFDDTLYLLKELKNHRSTLYIYAPECSLHFHIDSKKTLWVDMDCNNNGLWAASEITMDAAVEILRIAFDDGEFGELIPTTNQEWGAYAWSFGDHS